MTARSRIEWLEHTTHKDWLRDGRLCTSDQWDRLDWSKACMDMGPSPAGNPGPYWHVPDRDGDLEHRMYPKVMETKWAGVIRQAVLDAVERSRKEIAK